MQIRKEMLFIRSTLKHLQTTINHKISLYESALQGFLTLEGLN